MGARWLEYAVQRLVKNGHRFHDIPDYTIAQVVILLDAIDREEAGARASFLTDLATSVAGVLGGSEDFQKHLDKISDRQHN